MPVPLGLAGNMAESRFCMECAAECGPIVIAGEVHMLVCGCSEDPGLGESKNPPWPSVESASWGFEGGGEDEVEEHAGGAPVASGGSGYGVDASAVAGAMGGVSVQRGAGAVFPCAAGASGALESWASVALAAVETGQALGTVLLSRGPEVEPGGVSSSGKVALSVGEAGVPELLDRRGELLIAVLPVGASVLVSGVWVRALAAPMVVSGLGRLVCLCRLPGSGTQVNVATYVGSRARAWLDSVAPVARDGALARLWRTSGASVCLLKVEALPGGGGVLPWLDLFDGVFKHVEPGGHGLVLCGDGRGCGGLWHGVCGCPRPGRPERRVRDWLRTERLVEDGATTYAGWTRKVWEVGARASGKRVQGSPEGSVLVSLERPVVLGTALVGVGRAVVVVPGVGCEVYERRSIAGLVDATTRVAIIGPW